MTRYVFEIRSLMSMNIDDLGTDKEGIRSDLIRNLKEGKYDEELKKSATVSIGRKSK